MDLDTNFCVYFHPSIQSHLQFDFANENVKLLIKDSHVSIWTHNQLNGSVRFQ